MTPKTIIIAAGGTGGHIFPALAIAKELQKLGAKIIFVGNKHSMEEQIISKTDITFEKINVQKLYRKFTFRHFLFPFKLIQSIANSIRIINKFKPDAFVGTGGFVSGSVGIAAKLKNIPIFLQEQNSYPGLTTKFLGKFAKNIFLGNENARKYLPNEKSIFWGNPINISETIEKINFTKFGLKKDSFKIFLTGGSQGSAIINKVFFEIIDELVANEIEIIWQVGKYTFPIYEKKIQPKKGIYGFDFTHEIDKIYNSVDLVIARGGALTLAEIETKKIPSIIIPLPTAAENHQYFNALELKNKKVACIIKQEKLNSHTLKKEIYFMQNEIKNMKNNFSESKHLTAAINIASIIYERC
ncbi:MAG: undecaprenyldiphospho-muramoylpentapeptide beta-N-acetylglucosaminyltransferase [Candidatus Cloacimonetes bacterium]|jgi:UDP-N-acetylglucosamine--N-acetylmuramyl-(pentapeptide) pyrophosphoryl-undecaprenol N-acetylglucosamine transferase|nr:undecaprenyldiphospho-muramoylpentapeptide beta-N-acetylglucosaminyltransferase [Candidatus Cloacimonadota bacterium]MBT6993975.1 undecaprenyldiphospho-muramoylpentapeptide beta-N-acetylglucosaminyltransferase [Candidatus Cloacimonadota bacterium]MBT7469923.1 undecaprenyldiphospho-muramoylpentapeptide beta-N-acetylglucosaminyltransferase [Candidatus Cloacimonadota bacterium]